jgi:crotonobetainyl-CoA:carnitine CoA-transferase CaiB-like acyl-CoA transferase
MDRVGRADELQKEIDALLSDRLAADVLAALDAAGVPAGRIRTVPEVFAGYAPAGTGR